MHRTNGDSRYRGDEYFLFACMLGEMLPKCDTVIIIGYLNSTTDSDNSLFDFNDSNKNVERFPENPPPHLSRLPSNCYANDTNCKQSAIRILISSGSPSKGTLS